MLSLMSRAFEPSSSYSDKITYMTSVKYLQSIRNGNVLTVVEKIKDLLATANTKLQGLQFLEIALQQNSDIYLKGRWTVVLYDIIKVSGSPILKEHACRILCIIMPYMAKDIMDPINVVELQKFVTDVFPYLLQQVEQSVDWAESAAKCLSVGLRCIPHALETEKDNLLQVILKQVSSNVSPSRFEVFSDCFCMIPNCMRRIDKSRFLESWKKQYLKTLTSMHSTLNTVLTFLTDEPDIPTEISGEMFTFEDMEGEFQQDVYPAYMKRVRRFINLSKCLSKMLSTKTNYEVQVPVRLTLECITRLFQTQEISKIKPLSLEMQILISTLCQMQIAALSLVESLILNFSLVSYSSLVSELAFNALQASCLPNISSESISPLRQAVWKLLNIWISAHGAKVSAEIVSSPAYIIEELLKDISMENRSQIGAMPASAKSKKIMSINTRNKNMHTVCNEALQTLENVLYTGPNFFSKKLLQDVSNEVLKIAYSITPPDDNVPFPYDDDGCRAQLHSVLLAIAIVSNTETREPIMCANGIFRNALQDPSIKVRNNSYKAMAMCRLYLHPKKPLLTGVKKDLDDNKGRTIAISNFREWSSHDYAHNLTPVENVSNVSENITSRVAQTFHNPIEGEMTPDEYMQVDDSHYPEQADEQQCNGEDILEIQNSSQCQDDVESDEDEEDEEDEPTSFGEEDINMHSEPLYIPSTSKIHDHSVHIPSETEQNAAEHDFQELRPCLKSDGNIDISNKNMHLNGVRNLVPEEGLPSESAQNIANENGIYAFDEEEDLDDEEEGEEDEEEENISFPAEKKAPEYFETPSKKQKLDEQKELEDEERKSQRSPTLIEMKADFCCNEVDDGKS